MASSNTAQRLEQAAAHMDTPREEVRGLIDAFQFIQMLRLRHQHLEQELGRQGDNLIQPDKLNPLDRRILKEALRQARRLQQRLKLKYQL